MTQPKSKDLEARLEALEREAASFIGKLEKELEIAQGQRFTQEAQDDLKTRIAQARATYERILEPVRKDLQAVQAAEDIALRQMEAEIEARAAETKQLIKADFMKRWIQEGGSLESFDKIFEEQLYPQEMARRMGQQNDRVEEDQARQRARSAIRDGFSRF
jgi:hypothetical protein